MSAEHLNLWNCNKMCQSAENLNPYNTGTGEIVDSKIRKFFFLLQDKQIERDLRVTISIGSNKINDQCILVELTNDLNPVFLFILFITRTDFNTLRNDQGLNVEFQDFPEALVNLLDQCKDNVSKEESGGRFKLMLVDYCGTAAGGCIMDMNKIQIKIIEECPFRNICHLTLDILRATELQIRQKLEAEVCKTKQALLKESTRHDEALMRISQLVEEINDKNEIIQRADSVINGLKVEKEEDCFKIRSQAENQEKAVREECKEIIAEERKQFEKQVFQMQAKIEDLEKELRLFHEKELQMQSVLHGKEREKELVELELVSKKEEVIQLKTQNEKLDCDYHDKEKTVNILRTRIAVAEQELKDNSVLLINYQNKLEEVVQEKITFESNLEFLKKKLEKKDSTIKNLSDEIIKANDIIAKQQTKLSTFLVRINESEQHCTQLEQLLKDKEDSYSEYSNALKQLKEDLAKSSKESDDLREKKASLEKDLSERDIELKTKCKTLSELKDNFEDIIDEFLINVPQRSLLAYRTFLSMPTLLPSDVRRRTDDLWEFTMQDHISENSSLPSVAPSKNSLHRIIKPYIQRFLKRYHFIPLSIFKSLDTPLAVLLAPNGRKPKKTQSQETVNCVPEYDVCNVPINRYESAEYCNDSNRPNATRTLLSSKTRKLLTNQSSDLNKTVKDNFGLVKGSSVPPPSYAPVGAFQLKPTEKFQKSNQSNVKLDHYAAKNVCQDKGFTNFRKTPAVSAPPLTPEQRNAVDSVFKASRSQRSGKTSVKKNTKNSSGEKSSAAKTVCQISNLCNQVVTESVTDILCPKNLVCNKWHGPESRTFRGSFREPEALKYKSNKDVMMSKPYSGQTSSSVPSFEISVDLSEPSAYFVT